MLAVTPKDARAAGIEVNADGIKRSAFELLARPDVVFEDLLRLWPHLSQATGRARIQAETDAKYAVYLERQQASVIDYKERLKALLPADIDYAAIPGLSNEIRNRLTAARPLSLEHAYNIEGITPAAMTLLASYARRAEGLNA